MCLGVLLVFVDCTVCYTSSDEKGVEVAAGKRGKEIK